MDKPADKGGGSNHRRAEEAAREVSWKWKREPLQGITQTITLYYRKKVLDDIESVLTMVGGNKLLQQFQDGCFGHLLRFIGGTSCNIALHELISREIILAGARDDELWFRISGTNIHFSPAEYALITGLHFGSSSFDTLGSHEMPPNGVYTRLRCGRSISIKELWSLFEKQHLDLCRPEDYLKVAHVLALYLMALGYDQLKSVEHWVWVLVDDLDQWNRFPWGAYTYQALVDYVSILPKDRESERRGYHFYGPVWALQIWAYEAIPKLGNTCAKVAGQVTIPRCLKWSFPKGIKFPQHFFERKHVCSVTLEPTDEEQLQQYWLSVQTPQPLGVGYTSRRRRGAAPRVAETASSSSESQPQPQPRCSSRHTPLVESSLPDDIEVSDTDGSVSSAPKPSARPSRTQAYVRSSHSSGGSRPRHVRPWTEVYDEARLVDQVSDKVVDHLAQRFIPHMKQWVEDLFHQAHTQLEKPNAETAKAADEDKKEQSFDGGTSSVHISRMTENEPSPAELKRNGPGDSKGEKGEGTQSKKRKLNDELLETEDTLEMDCSNDVQLTDQERTLFLELYNDYASGRILKKMGERDCWTPTMWILLANEYNTRAVTRGLKLRLWTDIIKAGKALQSGFCMYREAATPINQQLKNIFQQCQSCAYRIPVFPVSLLNRTHYSSNEDCNGSSRVHRGGGNSRSGDDSAGARGSDLSDLLLELCMKMNRLGLLDEDEFGVALVCVQQLYNGSDTGILVRYLLDESSSIEARAGILIREMRRRNMLG